MNNFEFKNLTELEILKLAYITLLNKWVDECNILALNQNNKIAIRREQRFWTQLYEIENRIANLENLH